MPRKRNKENKGLPKRWQVLPSGIYYQVPPGLEYAWDGKKKFQLGKSLPEAYRTWAQRIDNPAKANNVAALLERYLIEIVPTKAPKTQNGDRSSIRRLTDVLGDMALTDIKPQTIYQYVDGREAKVAAHREKALLSHAFTKAVEWGYIETHSFIKQVRLKGETPRNRYVEDWEIDECLALKPKRKKDSTEFIQAYIEVKQLTALRRGDLLRLRTSYFKEDGIHITTSKTGKRIIIKWTPDLRSAINKALAVRPVDISPFLFCNKRGQGYMNEETGEPSGFNSIWQRFMARVLSETKVTERFTEHDIRAKSGSDSVSDNAAQALLTHDNVGTTRKIYRRKPAEVTPLR